MPNVTYIAPVKTESSIHKIRCAAYCRVSSNSEDQLHSYAAQVRFYSTKFNGSDTEELVDIYADEGITGTSADKRTEFNRLIKDCKMLYLAMKDITKKWIGRRQDWSSIYAQLVIYYGDRILVCMPMSL